MVVIIKSASVACEPDSGFDSRPCPFSFSLLAASGNGLQGNTGKVYSLLVLTVDKNLPALRKKKY